MSSKHTAEPWIDLDPLFNQEGAPPSWTMTAPTGEFICNFGCHERTESNARRVHACYVAMQGIPNPAAHAEYVKALVAESEAWRFEHMPDGATERIRDAVARTDAARLALAQTAQEDRT